MEINTIIKGSGHYIPERIVKNEEFMSNKFFDENGNPIGLNNEVIIEKFKKYNWYR